MNRLDLRGRAAVVTGGAQGIGAAIVARMEASGANVRVWDVAAKKDPVDVSDPAQVEKATAKVVTELNSPVVEYPFDEWERVLRVNLTSQFLCCRAVVPHMVKRKYGRIVNIASIAGREGNPNAVAY